MKGLLLTAKVIAEFKKHLILEERSAATIEKYVRDVTTFAKFTDGVEITKETVIAYKKIYKKIMLCGVLIQYLQA